MDRVRIVLLGGQDEVHNDCVVVEINDDIFVCNCGLKYPDITKPGVDFITFKPDYLINNKHRIKGYFLTHGHDPKFGGLAFIYNKAPAPIYCSDLTAAYFQALCEHINIDSSNFKFNIVKPDDLVIIDDHKINLFSLCSDIGNTFGISFETSQGNIVLCGNYVIENAEDFGFKFSKIKIGTISQKPTLLLMCGSINSAIKGYAAPSYNIFHLAEKQINDTKGRIIFVIDAPNVYNIVKAIKWTIKNNRKIIVYDGVTRDIFVRLIKCNFVNIPKDSIAHMQDVNRLRSDEVAVFIFGFGVSVLHKISLIAMKEHDEQIFTLNETDTVVVGTYQTFANEKVYTETIDDLYRSDCRIIDFKKKDLIKMAPCEEDIKSVISIFNPKYYVPIDGTFVNLLDNANIAVGMNNNLNHSNIFILDNGNVLDFNNGIGRISEVKVPAGDIYIDGKGQNEGLGPILEERKQISDDGIVILAATISNKEKKIVAGPDIQTRALIYVKENDNLLKEIQRVFVMQIEQYLSKENHNKAELEKTIKDSIFSLIRRTTLKTPLIVPYICELD